ncbi:cupin domain-containing protein [Nonomuraea salmonea]|uniref:cupin domain-containing protein n=1 Tax=Nonomuraea salmonea TaxID=46181 RepID=UPI0031ECD39F
MRIYPDGPSIEVADEAAALASSLDGQLVLDGRFLRRDVTGAPVAFVERPPVAAALDLLPHPEGGWFRETWRSPVTFTPDGYPGSVPAPPPSTSCSTRARSPCRTWCARRSCGCGIGAGRWR